MSPPRSLAVVLAPCLASMLACGSEVHLPTGGAGGATTTTTSSTTTSSTTTSASGTTSSTTTSAQCPSTCASDADCAPCGGANTGCCDLFTQTCYVISSDVCPYPCTPGGPCAAGGICSLDYLVGPCTCTCDDTGHFACAAPATTVPCPAVHPACGDPCDSSKSQSCLCTLGSDTAPCACSDGAWQCSAPGATCPPAVGSGMACTDFAPGTMCSVWICADWCGARMWVNGTGI